MDKYTIENLELFYGDFKALKNINMKMINLGQKKTRRN